MWDLTISVTATLTVLALAGEIDVHAARQLLHPCLAAIRQSVRVHVDLAAVTFIDAAGPTCRWSRRSPRDT